MHIGKPKIISGPHDVYVSVVSGSERVTLACEVTGDDINGYWERLDDDPLPNKTNMSLLSNHNTSLQLIIVGVRPEYSGIYQCVVYSQWGMAQSDNATVNITSESDNLLM